jgi:hypothetical protein
MARRQLMRVKLHKLAHSRTGEKGDIVNLGIFPYDRSDYPLLKNTLTADVVKRYYGEAVKGKVTRFEAPKIEGLNFVMLGALGGGRSNTLAFDESGKALASAILNMEIEIPDDHPLAKGKRLSSKCEVDRSEKTKKELDIFNKGKTLRVGMGAAWWGDRIDSAIDLAKRGNVKYLCIDSMSEITMSALQVKREFDQKTKLYDNYLEERVGGALPFCIANGTRMISNGGWLDPVGAQKKIIEMARKLNLRSIKVAAISGGDLKDTLEKNNYTLLETGEKISNYRGKIVSAEAYLGVAEIIDALKDGADVVIGSRIADSALVLAPLIYEFGWKMDDWKLLGAGSAVGHLIECTTYVTGGHFADPGFKDVPGIEDLGFPIAEVHESGTAIITKLEDTGGIVSVDTCKEQLLYEIHDPGNYLLPDVVADFTGITFTQIGEDRVLVKGAIGKPKPETLKCLVGIREGYQAEEMICYAGPQALERAKLARDIIERRFRKLNIVYEEMRIDFVGVNAVHREASPAPPSEPYEVIVRIAVKTRDEEQARRVRKEIDPMAVAGPAGTGKWAPIGDRVRPVIGLYSTLVPRSDIKTSMTVEKS